MVSQCPNNALHALYSRHLAPVAQNTCAIDLINPFTHKQMLGLTLKRAYQQAEPHAFTPGAWTISKPAWKVQKIAESHLVDRTSLGKARSFIKSEVHTQVKTKARLIQGHKNLHTSYLRPEEYLAVAMALKPPQRFEWDGTQYEFRYAAGMTNEQMSRFITRALAHSTKWRLLDERDGKNWDATMNEVLLRAEADVYAHLGMQAAAEYLTRATRVQGKIYTTDGFRRILIKYITTWRRLSGDWNTSIGNSLVSMIITFNVIRLLPPHLRPTRVWAMFMGDDYLGVYDFRKPVDPKDLAAALNHLERQTGIVPIRGLFRDPLRVTFMAMTLWPTMDGQFVFVPKPAAQLTKLFWSVRPREKNNITAYRRAISICMMPTFSGCPFMMEFLRAHMPAVAGQRSDQAPDFHAVDPWRFAKLRTEAAEVNWTEGFVYKYDIPTSALWWRMPQKPGIWHHPAVAMMLATENADPPDRKGCLAC